VQSFQEFDEERTAAFARAMHSTAMGHAQFLSRKLALKSAKTLLDMGGGPGTFTIHFLKENAELRATVFDLPETLKTTRKFVAAAKLEDRVSYQEGDFNETKLQGAFDVCFLSHIIHGQDELKNKALFKKIYAALNSGGRFIVQDFFLNRDRQSPQFSAVFALHMLLYTDRGRTYSFEETTSWLEETGFTNVKPLNLHLPRSIGLISAEKS
jgi:cyclopropane fatty-acyl-phospholipid synthase-like methyltransferase